MDSTTKFSGKAEVYAKYRPTYPQIIVEKLVKQNLKTSNPVIADIGAGTGIFTNQLLSLDVPIIAIEPNDDMMRIAKNNFAHQQNITFVQAPAEHTTIAAHSVDVITVAQAFHWFDVEPFKAECKRILKPQGKVLLLWNSRDSNSEMVQINREICIRHCPTFIGFSDGAKQSLTAHSAFFKDGKFDYPIFPNDLTFDLEGFIGRNLSASYAPKMIDENYNDFITEISVLFEKYNKGGMITMPNNTHCYLGEV